MKVNVRTKGGIISLDVPRTTSIDETIAEVKKQYSQPVWANHAVMFRSAPDQAFDGDSTLAEVGVSDGDELQFKYAKVLSETEKFELLVQGEISMAEYGAPYGADQSWPMLPVTAMDSAIETKLPPMPNVTYQAYAAAPGLTQGYELQDDLILIRGAAF
mmetsp:Transcript_56883/g.133666  ORF Transcript_56883/g.133666 Transcript_56883/m.133666 type:complete len:159 (-) Transcript_56883:92-568(-)